MAMIQKKLRAMFLWRDWIIVRALNDLSVGYIEFESARRATVFANPAGDSQCGFLSQRFELVPNLWRHGIPGHDALHDPGAVAQLRKYQLPARTQVIEPTFQRNFVANVFR